MIKRRKVLQYSAGILAAHSLGLRADDTASAAMKPAAITRPVPSSGERLPVMGMGTSRTFDTDRDAESLGNLTDVMRAFFSAGGSVIDSSPMYGNAESRVGDVLREMPVPAKVFAATKVWTTGRDQGIAQMEESARRMNVERFDLIAVHNLVDWQTQLDTLKSWKEAGRVRYIGITTSHGRDHEALLDIMVKEPLDFVQFSYNIEDRVAEERLLPTAQDRGIATMINRPFQRGSLFSRTRNQDLPALATELGCSSWAQFFLKFILGHPGVTCIIPATSKVSHMTENMQANFGPVPDTAQHAEMLRLFNAL